MALISVQQMAHTGTQATYSAVSASDTADISSGRVFLHVKNGGASSDTVTLTTPATVQGLAVADNAVAVPNGQERFFGPLDPALYGNSGVVTVTHSYTTSVTCAFVAV